MATTRHPTHFPLAGTLAAWPVLFRFVSLFFMATQKNKENLMVKIAKTSTWPQQVCLHEAIQTAFAYSHPHRQPHSPRHTNTYTRTHVGTRTRYEWAKTPDKHSLSLNFGVCLWMWMWIRRRCPFWHSPHTASAMLPSPVSQDKWPHSIVDNSYAPKQMVARWPLVLLSGFAGCHLRVVAGVLAKCNASRHE